MTRLQNPVQFKGDDTTTDSSVGKRREHLQQRRTEAASTAGRSAHGTCR